MASRRGASRGYRRNGRANAGNFPPIGMDDAELAEIADACEALGITRTAFGRLALLSYAQVTNTAAGYVHVLQLADVILENQATDHGEARPKLDALAASVTLPTRGPDEIDEDDRSFKCAESARSAVPGRSGGEPSRPAQGVAKQAQ